ncbi:MAG: serine/threonine protein kinase [Kofleriaceae bacterium]|nr:serine/threonine protein kinase [Kofleriaceae bacterium]
MVALAAMGLTDAARATLRELRQAAPETPAELPLFLRAARAAAPAPAAEKEIIAGRYRLVALLGAGSAGRVFRAVDEVSGKTVALKMFSPPGPAAAPPTSASCARAGWPSSLRHPALIEVYDVSLDHGFLVMEYLAGGSLAQRLATGDRLGGAQVRRLALELLGGLELAHHRGVVHRDVKPANIFLDSRGAAKLGDFGVAHLVDLGQTQTGGLIGSLAYMAPEQITGAPITIAADLYALGVTLFEALTGRLPFLGPDFVAQHLGERPAGADRGRARRRPRLGSDHRPAPAQEPERALRLDRDAPRRPRGAAPRRPLGPGGRAAPAAARQPPALDRRARRRRDRRRPRGAATSSRPRSARPWRRACTAPSIACSTARWCSSVSATTTSPRPRSRACWCWPAPAARSCSARCRSSARPAPRSSRPRPARALGEAAAGERPRPDPADLVRLLKRLARAVTAIHEAGGVHGAISPATVVIADGWIPTIMAAGLPPAAAGATTADDVRAVLEVVAAAARVAADELLTRAAWRRAPAQPARLDQRPAPASSSTPGADRVEVVALRARAAGGGAATADAAATTVADWTRRGRFGIGERALGAGPGVRTQGRAGRGLGSG